jgi:hypothetical protein
MFSAPSSLAVRVGLRHLDAQNGRDDHWSEDDPSEVPCSPCHHGSSQLAASLPPSVHPSIRCRNHHRMRLRRHRNRHPTARPRTFKSAAAVIFTHHPAGTARSFLQTPPRLPTSQFQISIIVSSRASSCRAASPLSSTLLSTQPPSRRTRPSTQSAQSSLLAPFPHSFMRRASIIPSPRTNNVSLRSSGPAGFRHISQPARVNANAKIIPL